MATCPVVMSRASRHDLTGHNDIVSGSFRTFSAASSAFPPVAPCCIETESCIARLPIEFMLSRMELPTSTSSRYKAKGASPHVAHPTACVSVRPVVAANGPEVRAKSPRPRQAHPLDTSRREARWQRHRNGDRWGRICLRKLVMAQSRAQMTACGWYYSRSRAG